MKPEPLLTVKDLKVHFPIQGGIFLRRQGTVYAVNGVNFSLPPGQTLGLVGESGCGKTTVGRAILNLIEATSGEINFMGQNIHSLTTPKLRQLRREMQIVFQDPFESLNPRHSVRDILLEPFIIHNVGDDASREKSVKELAERVGLGASALNRFPHEFSGGQRQRIGIARAIALKPKFIVCDEPVSALDVSIQSQIINLLIELQREMGLAYLFIAHDLAVVKHVSDVVAVMYLGKIVEIAGAQQLYKNPRHPYTQALLSAIPSTDPEADLTKKQILKGEPASPSSLPRGCAFYSRCPIGSEECLQKVPELLDLLPEENNSSQSGVALDAHQVACFKVPVRKT